MDIELILSKRAKNPWLDTGYAILSYLLTGKLFLFLFVNTDNPILVFAFIVWVLIYILKLGKKMVLFPRRLWLAYSDYVTERNRAVKEASIRSVVGDTTTFTNNEPMYYQRINHIFNRT